MIDLLDTHQHLIYKDKFEYEWTEDIPALAQNSFTVKDYDSLAHASGIGASIFMESGVDEKSWKEETRFALKLQGKQDNVICAVIASCRPENDADFDSWLEEIVAHNVVGCRRILHVVPDELSTTTIFRNNVRKLGKYDKTFDLHVIERQLDVGIELAKACDNTQMILNHCGVPDFINGDFYRWKKYIKQLAELDNVNCKISGVAAYVNSGQQPMETLRPYVEFCIEAFGFHRVVWGSDWPVCNMTEGLPPWVGLIKALMSQESLANQQKLFSQNAKRIYNIVT